ncbi:hypothetical protein [Sphingobacterium bambusae]
MDNQIYEAIKLLREIRDALMNIIDQYANTTSLPLKRRIYSKQQVLEMLNMTEITYRRNLKKGLLKPIRIAGIDLYFEEDLIAAMNESRRKGKL